MGAMRYKHSDKVRIKSLDWYNKNKDEYGNVGIGDKKPKFTYIMSQYCDKIFTIDDLSEYDGEYYMLEDGGMFNWTDEMIEGLVEEEAKSHNNMCKQLIDEMNPNVEVNVKTPKFKIGDRVITDTNMKGKIIDVVEEGWYRVDFDDYNGISQPNGVVLEENMTIMTKETKPEPKFKVGDIIISVVFTTNDDKGWKVIDVERTGYKLMSVNNSDLICGMDFKNEHYYKLVEEEIEFTEGDKYWCDIMSESDPTTYVLPQGYQFVDDNGNVINAKKIVLEKKKKEYPKTYEECAKIMNCPITGPSGWLFNYDANIKEPHYRKIDILMGKFTRLLICRDAYWKIAGEEMELGKPWEPDWANQELLKYCISNVGGKIKTSERYIVNTILAFPTPEMLDAFYENFKEEIEICKELL